MLITCPCMGVIMTKIDDSQVTSYFTGDPVSAQELTDIFHNRYRRRGFSEEDALDPTQETMLAIWEEQDASGMKDAPGSYSAGIGANKAKDAWRVRYRNKETPMSFYPGSDKFPDEEVRCVIENYGYEPEVVEDLACQELGKRFDGIVESLPDGARRCVMACIHMHRDNLSLKEIGETMGIESLGTIKSLISRGKKLLSEKLDREGNLLADVRRITKY